MRHLLLTALLLAVLGCTPPDDEAPATGHAADDAGVVALVNGEPVTRDQFELYAARRGMPEDAGQRRELIDDLVSIQLLAQFARDQGVHERSEIAAQLEMQRNALLAQTVIRERLDADPITDEELQAEYQAYLDEGVGEELHARHILVEEEDHARDLIRQLDEGADFAALAEDHSMDTGTAPRGGDLGWFEPELMIAPFSRAAGELEAGEYTADPVETRFGWHVIRLEGRRAGEPVPFEEMREEFQGLLQSERIEAWVNELRGQAEVDIRD